jgi:hypothetical protein
MVRRLILSVLMLASLGLLTGTDSSCFFRGDGGGGGGVIIDE